MNKHHQQTLVERVIKGGFMTLSLTFIASVIAYSIRVFFSQTLSIEEYGLLYAVFGLFNIVATYSDFGLGYSTAYLIPKYIKKKKYHFAWNVFIWGQVISNAAALIISVIFLIIAPVLEKSYFKIAGSANLVYIFCIYLIGFTILNGLIQLYTGMQKEKYYSSITIFRWFFSLSAALLFFFFDQPKVIYYAISLVVGHLLTALLFFALLFKKYSYLTKNKVSLDNKILKLMWPLAVPSFLIVFISSLTIFSDNFYLTLFRGVREVGLYNIIYPAASLTIVLLTPLQNFLLPMTSFLMDGEKEKVSHIVNKILEVVPFIGLYFGLFIFMFPSTLIYLIFGQKWVGLVEKPLMVLSMVIIVATLVMMLNTIVLGTGKVKDLLKFAIFMSIFYIVLNGVLTYYYGVLGTVINSGVYYLVNATILISILKSQIPVTIPVFTYLKMISVSIIIYLVPKLLGFVPKDWISFILSGIVYSIIFLSMGFLLNIYNKGMMEVIYKKKVSL